MNLLRLSQCAIVVHCLLALGDLSRAQTPPEPYACDLPTLPAAPDPIPTCQTPCDPFPPPGPACATCNFGSTCTVTTMLELTSALRCLATTGQCTHITIPSTATIAFCDTIAMGNVHAGLHLTINGTLLWVAPAAPISPSPLHGPVIPAFMHRSVPPCPLFGVRAVEPFVNLRR